MKKDDEVPLSLARGPKMRFVWRAIAIMGSGLVALAILEVAARQWFVRFATPQQRASYSTIVTEDMMMFQPHPYLPYVQRPGYKAECEDEPDRICTSINKHGFRGPEFPREKPQGEFRIAAMGGSTTNTVAVRDDALTYPGQLQTILHTEYGHRQVEVINAGVNDYTSWETLISFELRVLDLSPDLIIVYHGPNDYSMRNLHPSVYLSDGTGYRKEWGLPWRPWFERSLLYRIIATRQGRRTPFVLETMVESPNTDLPIDGVDVLAENKPIFFRRNLRNLIAIAREHGVEVLLATFAFQGPEGPLRRAILEQNEVLKELAAAEGVPLLDFAALMSAEPQYWADDMHLTADGARLKADHFARFLVSHEKIP